MLILLGLVACSWSEAWVPRAAPAGLVVRDVDFEHLAADVLLDVHNPLPFAVPLAGAEAAFAVDGQVLTRTVIDATALAADTSTRLAVPVQLRWEELLGHSSGERLGWTLDAAVHLDLPGGVRTLTVQPSGSLPALRPPEAWLLGVEPLRVDPLAGELAVLVRLGTRGVAGVEVTGGTLSVALDDAVWARAAALPGADGSLHLPVSLHAGPALRALGASLYARRVPALHLVGTLDVDTPFGAMPLSIDRRWP